MACCAYADRGCKKFILVPLYRFYIELIPNPKSTISGVKLV